MKIFKNNVLALGDFSKMIFTKKMQIRLYKRNKHNETNEKKHFILKMDTWGIPPSLETQQPKRISL